MTALFPILVSFYCPSFLKMLKYYYKLYSILKGVPCMTILGAFMVPHPPLIIPEVGRGNERGISATIAAYEEVAQLVVALQPETIVVTSPHTVMYRDYFHISPGAIASGDFAQFNAPQVQIHCDYDREFVFALEAAALAQNFPAGTHGEREPELDHATMIPLYFINKLYKRYKLVRIGLSGESLLKHYQLGEMIAATAKKLRRRIVVIGSGDLSHKLTKNGPYGFNPAGPEYDKRIMQVMSQANFGELFNFTDSFCEEAAECGHRSFTILAGTLDGLAVEAQQLSYEGPFGVGYGVCAYAPCGTDDSRHFGDQYATLRAKLRQQLQDEEDTYVKLARATIESYIIKGKHLPLPKNLPEEMLQKQAGTFVSLHINGQLRGCIGTIGPVQCNIAQEIMHNAISASTEDPRFNPVRPEELPDLDYSVDVLGELEPIKDASQLDVKRYGVIVTKGNRRGLLLPNLDGVDTVEQQISIACQKAGLAPQEKGISLMRFEVIRHH